MRLWNLTRGVAPPTSFAYATAEFTYLGNSFDTADTTYIGTFAYPTKLTTSKNGAVVGTSSWKHGTQAQTVVAAIAQVMPSGPTSRIATTVSSASPSADRSLALVMVGACGILATRRRRQEDSIDC